VFGKESGASDKRKTWLDIEQKDSHCDKILISK